MASCLQFLDEHNHPGTSTLKRQGEDTQQHIHTQTHPSPSRGPGAVTPPLIKTGSHQAPWPPTTTNILDYTYINTKIEKVTPQYIHLIKTVTSVLAHMSLLHLVASRITSATGTLKQFKRDTEPSRKKT